MLIIEGDINRGKMTEQRNHRVYEVSIQERVILTTTFRVAVDVEDKNQPLFTKEDMASSSL